MPKPKSKPDPAAVAAQNRSKIEKDRRVKNYHDAQVQGTNNSSIVSKRSVELLYNPIVQPASKEWFKFFVSNCKRRSPAINRGYWLRMASIKQCVLKIQAAHGQKVRVVNLGCGFDPLPFQMLDEASIECEFYDFDYPELVQRKLAMINDSQEILDVIGPKINWAEDAKEAGVILSTETYTLVGCDLKNFPLYKKQLHSLLRGKDGPVVFIAEVSLAYMKPELANAIVEILARLANSHVLVLEQIMPSGKRHFFAQKMLYHFKHLTSPLLCVETYSTQEKQKARFEKYFPLVEVFDLFEGWKQLVLTEQKHLVDSVEEFDEWEEFIVFCQHYVIIHGTNSTYEIFAIPEPVSDPPVLGDFSIKEVGSFEMKFPAACEGENGVYVNGGMFQSRSDTMALITIDGVKHLDLTEGPQPRMCHTLTNLGNGTLLLVGGRTRPGYDLNDIWIFDEKLQIWKKVGNLHVGVSRHRVVSLGHQLALLYAEGEFYRLNLDKENKLDITGLRKQGDEIPSLKSFGFDYNPVSKTGHIAGGTTNQISPLFNEGLYSFSVESNSISLKLVKKSVHFARIGCMLRQGYKKLTLLGGVGQKSLTQDNTVVDIYLDNLEIFCLRIPDAEWDGAPVFIGSQLVGNTIVGGGAVCYSFGSHYNKIYSVEFN